MRISVLGTGMVGRAHAARLVEKGDFMGNEPFHEWQQMNPGVNVGTFAEVVINATLGAASMEALGLAGAANLAGKILVDISNPLDFSAGMPPSLFVSNTDSLGEQIQRSFPQARVVKTLNTVTAPLQVDPGRLAGGQHHAFLSSNDAQSKAAVAQLLKDAYGWQQLIDLGDITTARNTEMMLPIWLRLRMGVLDTPFFNFRVVMSEEKRT